MGVTARAESVAFRLRDFALRHPAGDWIVGLLVVLVVRFGHAVPGIAHPPSDRAELDEVVVLASTNLWALFAAVLTALVFFYGLHRGEWIRRAESLEGARMAAAWRASILANFWFALTVSVIVDPMPIVGWFLVFAAAVMAFRVLRVIYLVLDHVTLLRKGWVDERMLKDHQDEQASRPSISSRYTSR